MVNTKMGAVERVHHIGITRDGDFRKVQEGYYTAIRRAMMWVSGSNVERAWDGEFTRVAGSGWYVAEIHCSQENYYRLINNIRWPIDGGDPIIVYDFDPAKIV